MERKLTLTSEPSGALVYMNDREVGRTPIETDFIWYGKYDVQVRKEGYVTFNKPQRLKTPWWQIPPIDLLAEMAPWHPTDRQALHFVLKPREADNTPPEELVSKALLLKPQLESTKHPTTTPSTVPATRP